MLNKELPTIELLRKLLVCDAEAGKLYWRERPVEMFSAGGNGQKANAAGWNLRFAGTEAFTAINDEGYRTGKIFGTTHQASRVIFAIHNGRWPENQIDHENGIRHDDRIGNLRDVTNQVNSQNKQMRCTNTSGHTGVSYKKRLGKWQAQISVGGDYKYLGIYTDINEAIKVRKMAEIEHGFHANHGAIMLN